jgi:hypothetical protein
MRKIQPVLLAAALAVGLGTALLQATPAHSAGLTRAQAAKVEADLRRAIAPWQRCFRNALEAKVKVATCHSDFRKYTARASALSKEYDDSGSDADAAESPGAALNVLALVYNAVRQSVARHNEDKAYWLQKLKELNDIADALADYVAALNEAYAEAAASEDGTSDAKGRREAEKERRRAMAEIQELCRVAGIKRCPTS